MLQQYFHQNLAKSGGGMNGYSPMDMMDIDQGLVGNTTDTNKCECKCDGAMHSYSPWYDI